MDWKILVKAYLKGEGTQKEIASLFGVGVSTLECYLRQYEESVDLAARPHPGKPAMQG